MSDTEKVIELLKQIGRQNKHIEYLEGEVELLKALFVEAFNTEPVVGFKLEGLEDE